MRAQLDKDAKDFVDGVVGYLQKGKHSTKAVPKLTTLLRRVSSKQRSDGVAHVQSAVALTASERTALVYALTRALGRTVTLECTVTPSLLGGLRIGVGNWVVDTSWEGQLQQISNLII